MSSWRTPLPFIGYKNNKFVVNSETARKLKKIDKPLSIVCIAGRLRSGKSYLMNRLVGKKGFPVGSTVEAVTKGIWVWYVNHPTTIDAGLIVLDTEGLDDPEGDRRDEYDLWILSLSVLLSSTFVYNEIGLIGNSLIEKLSFVSEFSQRIQYEASRRRDGDFDGFFPHFVLVVRDVSLEMEIGGEDVTDDEYMEKMMLSANKDAKTSREKRCNETKLKLRKYFPHRKCFTMVNPIESGKKNPNKLCDAELPLEFVQKCSEFCAYIYENSPMKKIHKSKDVTGEIFVQLATIYLAAINANEVPCIESASRVIAKNQNAKAIESSVSKYKRQMAAVPFPVDREQLEQVHTKSQEDAVVHFFRKSFFDKENTHYEALQIQLANEYVKNVQVNLSFSKKKCDKLLEKFYKPIKQKLKSGQYLSDKGFESYRSDVEDLKKKFENKSKKGTAVPADMVLDTFLVKRKQEEDEIAKLTGKLQKKNSEDEFDQLQARLESERMENEKNTRDVLTRALEDQTKRYNAIKSENFAKMKESYDAQFAKRQVEIKRLKRENFFQHAKELSDETKCLTTDYHTFLERSAQHITLTAAHVERMLSLTVEAIKTKLREILCGDSDDQKEKFARSNPFVAY